MRHRKDKLKLSRNWSQRKALAKLLVRNLILEKRTKTTLTKAKVASRLTDKVITMAKKDTLAARRNAYKILEDHKLVKELFDNIAPSFKDVAGGYTRVIKVSLRKGDGAKMAIVEFKNFEPKTALEQDSVKKETPKKEIPKKETPKKKTGDKSSGKLKGLFKRKKSDKKESNPS